MATKSILQLQADKLRELKVSIEDYEKIEQTLRADVEQCELELMRARSNLLDTQTLLFAKRDKLRRDASDMHMLIEKAVGQHFEAKVCGEGPTHF